MSAASNKQLKLAFFDAMTPLLEKEGFALVSTKDRYLRDAGDHREELWIAFLEQGLGPRIQPSTGIRYRQIEDVFHKSSGFPSESQAWTCTVGASFGVLKGGTAQTFQIPMTSPLDAQFAAEEFIKAYQEVAVPYFARWSSLSAIDEGLNDHPADRVPQLKGGLAWFRCSTGLAVAKFVNRPNYDELKSFYIDVMTEDNKGFYLERFHSLIDSLSEI